MWWGSGFITQILYATFADASGETDSNALLTENNLNILTETGFNIDTETP